MSQITFRRLYGVPKHLSQFNFHQAYAELFKAIFFLGGGEGVVTMNRGGGGGLGKRMKTIEEVAQETPSGDPFIHLGFRVQGWGFKVGTS